MRGIDLALTVTVGVLTFIAGRRSVKRQFKHIENSSGHTLVIRLDDDGCLHIEEPDEESAHPKTKEPK